MALSAEELDKINKAILDEQSKKVVDYINNNQPKMKNSDAAIDLNKRLMSTGNIFNTPEARPDGFNILNYGPEKQMSNGNPQLQRGISQLMLPGEDQAFNIPTTFINQMSAESSYNQGRSNIFDKYFGKAGGGQYSSYGQTRDYLNRVSQLPMFQGQGAFNQRVANQDQRKTLMDQRNAITGNTGGVITEQRSAGGKMVGGNAPQVANIDKQLDNINKSEVNSNARIMNYRAADQERTAKEMMARLEKIKATTSNLPIVERVVR